MKYSLEHTFEIFENNYDKLIRFAFQFVLRRHLAEEAVQDVAIKLISMKTLPEWQSDEHCKNYLFRSVRNQALTILQQETKDLRIISDEILESKKCDSVNDIETMELLERILSSYPPEIKEAFIRHVLYEERIKELAEELNMKPNTLTNYFKRIKVKAREMYYSILNFVMICKLVITFWLS